MKILNKHGPLKIKLFDDNAFNQNSYIFLKKDQFHFNWQQYKNQRNLCLDLLRKTKKQYFVKLNFKDVADNKLFWKNFKPYFRDKGS